MVIRSGKVAVRHYNSNPATIMVKGNPYSFSPNYCVSLGWVDKEIVNDVLSIKARICCGNTSNKFFLASELDVSIWETGERPKT